MFETVDTAGINHRLWQAVPSVNHTTAKEMMTQVEMAYLTLRPLHGSMITGSSNRTEGEN